MAISILPDRQYGAPANADGVSLTTPGASWTHTSWGELIPEADAALILTGLCLRPVGVIFDGYNFEAEVGVGPEGDEDTIATFKGFLHEVFASVGSEGLYLPTGFGIDLIPAGSRVCARWRIGDTAAQLAHLSIAHLKKPLSGSLLTTTNPLLCSPSGAPCLDVLTSGTAWDPGATVEIFSGIGAPSRAIAGIITHVQSAGLDWQVDLCAGDDDDVVTTIRPTRGGVSSFPNFFPLRHPLVIPAGTSLSAQASSEDNAVLTVQVGVSYVEQ